MKSLNALVWRSLIATRTRTLLTLFAVALGAATTIAVSMVGQSIRRGLFKNQEVATIMGGMVSYFDPMLSFVGLMIMLAAAFLVYNAFAMSVTHRRQQIGALRTLGTTRAQIWRLLLSEALVIGLIGAGVGLFGGLFLGKVMVIGMQAVLGGMIPLEEAPPLTSDVFWALVMSLSLALVAMLFPARLAMRLSPLAALKAPESAPMEKQTVRRAKFGLALAILLLGGLVVAPPGVWVKPPLDFPLTIAALGLWLGAFVLLLPVLAGMVGRRGRRLFARHSPGIGRLVSDNIQRGQRRVTLTVFTLALAVLVITGLTGFIGFVMNDLMLTTWAGMAEQQVFYAGRIDVSQGWTVILNQKLETMMMNDADVDSLSRAVEGKATVTLMYFVISPELSFLGDGYFSVASTPEALMKLGSAFYTFSEGDWESARPLMEQGCAVLITPLVAARNGVTVGDPLEVHHQAGRTLCIVAGIGSSAAGISAISTPHPQAFTNTGPLMAFIRPILGADVDALQAKIRAAVPNLRTNSFSVYMDAFADVASMLTAGFDGMLLLALLAAGMSVVNTMMMSVVERQHELALLRAVGATRSQVSAVIAGEAALMGLIGGLAGAIAGLGCTVVFVVTYGGSSFGLQLALWPAALHNAKAALGVALFGVIAAPLIAVGAAWLPARHILRENPIETLAGQ